MNLQLKELLEEGTNQIRDNHSKLVKECADQLFLLGATIEELTLVHHFGGPGNLVLTLGYPKLDIGFNIYRIWDAESCTEIGIPFKFVGDKLVEYDNEPSPLP